MDDQHPQGVVGGSSGAGGLATNTHRAGNSVVLALAGEIDMLTEPTARAGLDAALTQLPRSAGAHPVADPAHHNAADADRARLDDAVPGLVIDLTEVTFLSSTGLQLLITADRAAADRGLGLRVISGTRSSVLGSLEISGLDATLTVVRSLDEALTGHAQRTTDSPRTRGQRTR